MISSAVLREFLALYRQLAYTTPWHTGIAILLRIFAQISLLTLLLLPWKLLMVLYGGALPEAAPASLRALEQDQQVLVLGMAILMAMALHAGCELASHSNIRSGAAHVCNRNNKISLFQNQSSEAETLYSHLLQAMSALTSCLLATAFIAAAYPSLLTPLAAYAFACGVFWQLLLAPYADRRRRLGKSLPLLLKLWWQGGFLLILAWVLLDYRRGQLPSMFAVLASLILARQLLLLWTETVQHWFFVYRAGAKARVLFLRGEVWQPAATGEASFEALLEEGGREAWIGELLGKQLAGPERIPAVHCRMADSGNIAYLKVCKGPSCPQPVLLKLHSRARESAAEQEWALLQVAQRHWPAPTPLSRRKIGDHLCLSLEWRACGDWLDSHERNLCLPELRQQLLGCDIGPELQERYDRTHAPLATRMQAISWDQLQSHAQNRAQRRACAELSEHWPELQQSIAALPRQLLLPRLARRLLARNKSADGDYSLILYDWSQWRWEPLGSGHPLAATLPQQLEQVLETASELRPSLADVSPQLAACAARVYEFERRYCNRNYVGAMNMLDGLLQQWSQSGAYSDQFSNLKF